MAVCAIFDEWNEAVIGSIRVEDTYRPGLC